MKKKKQKISVHGRWKQQKKDSLIISWLIISATLLSLMILLSMGSRGLGSRHSFDKSLNGLRDRIRGWDKSLETLSNETEPKEDTRSHAAFHFRWHRKFNPPEWRLDHSNKNSRPDLLLKALKLGKSNLILSPSKGSQELFLAKEFLSRNSDAAIEKTVLPLLPGERLQISAGGPSSNTKHWKLRLRTIGATQDRLDAPLRLTAGFTDSLSSNLEIDPRGAAKDIELPPSGEFAKNASKSFYIQWPETASGILMVEGFFYVAAENENHSTARTVIVFIDELNQPLTALTKTLQVLKGAAAGGRSTLHLTDVIPPSRDKNLNLKAIKTLRNPVELGATLRNDKLRSFIQPEPLLLNKYVERGGSLRLLTLGRLPKTCKSPCVEASESSQWADEYSSSLSIRRKDEFSSASRALTADSFLLDDGLIVADLEFPAEAMRLNWDSAFETGQPFLRWILGGLKDAAGINEQELKFREKLLQTDIWVSKLTEIVLAGSENTNLAIILNRKSETHLSRKGDPGNSVVAGEALVSAGKFTVTEDKPAFPTTLKSKVSLLSAVKLLEKLNTSKERTLSLPALAENIDSENIIVSQLSDDVITTHSNAGWLTDNLSGISSGQRRSVFSADPEQIHNIQEKSNAERRRSRLHGLNILLPNNNDKDELISISVSSNLKPVGCESESENAQSDLRADDSSGFNEKNLNTVHILGRRSAQTQWHLHCVLEGRISTATRLKVISRLNNQPVARERIGLGEFSLPVRGFLWRSPETLELTGAQILDATAAVKPAERETARQSSVVIWTDTVVGGLNNARMTFSWTSPQTQPANNEKVPAAGAERLSGK
jgi:hypothetical protein